MEKGFLYLANETEHEDLIENNMDTPLVIALYLKYYFPCMMIKL